MKSFLSEPILLGLFDDNKYWENIIRYLMNAVYGLDLKNLNEEKINYPGIDLGDQSEKKNVLDNRDIYDVLKKKIM